MAAPANKGLVALFKRGWNEIPEIMGASVQGLVGAGLLTFTLYTYYKNDGDNRPYRNHYVVMRHDDPRVPKLKTTADVTGMN